jgi:hypothetical protein
MRIPFFLACSVKAFARRPVSFRFLIPSSVKDTKVTYFCMIHLPAIDCRFAAARPVLPIPGQVFFPNLWQKGRVSAVLLFDPESLFSPGGGLNRK